MVADHRPPSTCTAVPLLDLLPSLSLSLSLCVCVSSSAKKSHRLISLFADTLAHSHHSCSLSLSSLIPRCQPASIFLFPSSLAERCRRYFPPLRRNCQATASSTVTSFLPCFPSFLLCLSATITIAVSQRPPTRLCCRAPSTTSAASFSLRRFLHFGPGPCGPAQHSPGPYRPCRAWHAWAMLAQARAVSCQT